MATIARVRVTVEITLSQPWNDSETMGNAAKMAETDALQALDRAVQNSKERIKVVSTPIVDLVVLRKDE